MSHKCPTDSQWKCPAAREALVRLEWFQSQDRTAGCAGCDQRFYSIEEFRLHHKTPGCMSTAEMEEVGMALTNRNFWVLLKQPETAKPIEITPVDYDGDNEDDLI